MTDSGRTTTRRTMVGGIVGLGVATPLLAACGGSDEASGGSGGSSTTSGGAIGKTSEVPVGGGKIFTGEKVLVSQPEAGEFKAFSTICTHQKCAITELKGEEIECGCHHSKFSIMDGSNTRGPNNTEAGSVQPLSELSVSVKNGEITVSS